jgi:hypothetical protein
MIWYLETPTHWILIPRENFGMFKAVTWDGQEIILKDVIQRRVMDATILEKR